MNTSSQTPTVVKILGYGGLIPFIGLALINFFKVIPTDIAQSGLLYYAAIILSFIAALHWGFAMFLQSLSESQRNIRYIWSVIPPLAVWFSILLDPASFALILITGYLANLWQDILLKKIVANEIPQWYLPLRIQLTFVAVLCIASTLINQ